MRQVDFLRQLATENEYDYKELTAVWDKAMALIRRKLVEGEPVHIELGEFFPSLFLASEDAPDENGEGPLIRASDRGRDRVIPTFTWNVKQRRLITDYSPVSDSVRAINAIRTARYFREKNFKAAIYKKSKAGG